MDKIPSIFILILFSLINVNADESKGNEIINKNINNYAKEVLKVGVDSPYQLAIHYANNILYFSYSTSDTPTGFKSAFLDLKTNQFETIKGINGFANAVDQDSNTVYLGASDGIYEFDTKSKTTKHINGTLGSIWQMFFKKGLYYSTYPDERVYVYKNGKSMQVPELSATRGMLVALDNYENIYFSNSSGLHIYNKTEGRIVHLGDYTINSITSDINGKLYFSTPNGIYFIDSENEIQNLITMTLNDIYGVAVESNGNLIYSSEDSIIRLKRDKIKN